jgi:tRNA dimethylallyltransferase
MKNSIIILGPTASGKTRLAARLAQQLNGAVLSFDSRQVYKELNIGTGKDKGEFSIEGSEVPHYLIDLVSVKESFNIYDFVTHFINAWEEVQQRQLLPILCGGTGLYFDAVLKKLQYINIPNNSSLREEIGSQTKEALVKRLSEYPQELISHSDISSHKRLIRAIEVAEFLQNNSKEMIPYPEIQPMIFGIDIPVIERKRRINERLIRRMEEGLVEEIEGLLQRGVDPEKLITLGLEYKFVTNYLMRGGDKEEMLKHLEIAIHQYAKRQMTWFRRMEREGFGINWVDGEADIGEQMRSIEALIND